MLSAAQCREKAAAWSLRAEKAPEGKFRARLERIARNWAELAKTAEAAEALERRHVTPRR
jgi:hypothetical protein